MPAPVEYFIAAREGDVATLRGYLHNGVDINSVNAGGATALEMASQSGKLDVVQVLLSLGASPNPIVPDAFSSALISASTYGHDGIVRLLLENGADPDFPDTEGQTALIWAAGHGMQIEIIETLLKFGASASIRDKSNNNAAEYAKANGHAKIAALLTSL